VIEIRELLQTLAAEQGVTVFMSSHILAEVDRLATRIGIVHQGRLIEELDSEALERHRDRRLEVGVRDVDVAESALRSAGFEPERSARNAEATPLIELRDARAIDAPDEVARLLVAASVPPTHLAIAHESLEEHFMRITAAQQTPA